MISINFHLEMEHLDDSIFDNIRFVSSQKPNQKKSNYNSYKKSSPTQSNSKIQPVKANSKPPYNSKTFQSDKPIINKVKKSKRLPWNNEVLKDRYTPQPFQIQLVDLCINSKSYKSLLVLLRNEEYRSYLKIMIIKEYQTKIRELMLNGLAGA